MGRVGFLFVIQKGVHFAYVKVLRVNELFGLGGYVIDVAHSYALVFQELAKGIALP